MEITKIVITGGPCAGKTTAMSWVQKYFTAMGYAVLFVPETATERITGGVAHWTCGSNAQYQQCQMQLQLAKEKVFAQGEATMKQEKVLIVCDRGALDNKAYMTDAEFASVLESMGLNEVELRDSYDAVFHLVTAAKGAEIFYTTANNAARTETVEQAAALDDKLIAAWTGHPHLRQKSAGTAESCDSAGSGSQTAGECCVGSQVRPKAKQGRKEDLAEDMAVLFREPVTFSAEQKNFLQDWIMKLLNAWCGGTEKEIGWETSYRAWSNDDSWT